VRFRITPRDTTYFDQFTTLAEHIRSGADLLAQLLTADRAARKILATRFDALESEADEAAGAIQRRLAQTFVTPFDRDDIYDLANALDDVVDEMEEAADLIVLYKVEQLPSRVGEVAVILQKCAALTVAAMPKLQRLSELGQYVEEINVLENKGDKLHRKLVAELFMGDDPITIIKLKEIVDVLERACDAFEKVAKLVETIALKES